MTRILQKNGIKLRPSKRPWIVVKLDAEHSSDTARITMVGNEPIKLHYKKPAAGLSYLMGWLLGDGHTRSQSAIAFLSQREKKIMEPIIKKEIGRFGKVTRAERNGLLLSSSSHFLSRILSTYEGKQNWENIDLMLSSPRFACHLIAGLWDADGSVYRERSGQLRIRLYNSDLRLLDKIAESLHKVYAIETALYRRAANSPESRILSRSDRFDLYVIASSNIAWVRSIGTKMFLPWKKA